MGFEEWQLGLCSQSCGRGIADGVGLWPEHRALSEGHRTASRAQAEDVCIEPWPREQMGLAGQGLVPRSWGAQGSLRREEA